MSEVGKVTDGIEIFVSPTGSDLAAGTKEAPLATIEAARKKVREQKKDAPITVNIRGGEYSLTESVKFNEEDSGSEKAPITYRAYEGEEVRIYGGIHVDKALVTKADPKVAARVISKEAADKLMQIDLSGVVDVIPDYYCFGHTENQANIPMEIYLGGKPLVRSCWPNGTDAEPFLQTAGSEFFEDQTRTFLCGDRAKERMKLWAKEAADDLYIHGKMGWYFEDYDASDLDVEAGSMHLKGALAMQYFRNLNGIDYYFFNLPEEIDVPGECFIDHAKKIVYFYPYEDTDYDNIYVSVMTDSLFDFTNTKHITLDGLKFLYSRGRAVETKNAWDFKLLRCEIAHTSSDAAALDGTRILVDRCHVYDTAHGGLRMTGGDLINLVSGEAVVQNCEIHDINRGHKAYEPGVYAGSLGMAIRHNKMYNSEHTMILVQTNDVLIEYNDFRDCVLASADMGVIYFGRNPVQWGTVIRYNYFCDIGKPYGHGEQICIYMDDGGAGAVIYGNVFKRGTYNYAVVKSNAAKFSQIYNNIFLDSPTCFFDCGWDESDTDDWTNCYSHGGGDEATDPSNLAWVQWAFDTKAVRQVCGAIPRKLRNCNFQDDLWQVFLNWHDSYIHGKRDKSEDIGEVGWYLWLYDRHHTHVHSIIDKMKKVNFDSPIWREHYKGTTWEQLYKCVDSEKLETYPKLSQKELSAKAVEEAPHLPNKFTGNVLVNCLKGYSCLRIQDSSEKNFETDDKSIFVDPENDFRLTEEGLLEVRRVYPAFENVPFELMGIEKE